MQATQKTSHVTGRGLLAAFTLLEMIVAIVIISILSTIAFVGYGRFAANAEQAAVDATAGSLQRAMSAMVLTGSTPQEAFDIVLVNDLPSGVSFTVADGSDDVVGGVSELVVTSQSGWSASFLAPRPGRGDASAIISGGYSDPAAAAPVSVTANSAITVGSQANADRIIKFDFNGTNVMADLTVQYCQLPGGCQPSEMVLLTDTVTNTKTRNLHGVASGSVVYATVGTSDGIDSWVCQLDSYKPPALCGLIAS